MFNTLNMGGGGMGQGAFGVPAAVANPETVYATQLEQLRVRSQGMTLMCGMYAACAAHRRCISQGVAGQAACLDLSSQPAGFPKAAHNASRCGVQAMGFYDEQANIQALQAAGGNVNAAVERLLGS